MVCLDIDYPSLGGLLASKIVTFYQKTNLISPLPGLFSLVSRKMGMNDSAQAYKSAVFGYLWRPVGRLFGSVVWPLWRLIGFLDRPGIVL